MDEIVIPSSARHHHRVMQMRRGGACPDAAAGAHGVVIAAAFSVAFSCFSNPRAFKAAASDVIVIIVNNYQ